MPLSGGWLRAGLASLLAAVATVSTAGAAVSTAAAARPADSATTAVPVLDRHTNVAGYGGGDLSAVSCATARLCVAVDGGGAQARWNGRSWSAPRSIEPHRPDIGLTGVSCPSATFCTAVDRDGAAVFFNGHGWSRPVTVDHAPISSPPQTVTLPLTAVSCTSRQFCVGTDAGSPLTHNGDFVMFSATDPAAAMTLPSGAQALAAVSCASPAFCLAVSTDSSYQVYRRGNWSRPHALARGKYFPAESVSCVSARFCIAADYSGRVSIFSGRSWTGPQLADPQTGNGDRSAVSCAGTRACVIVAGDRAARWNGRRWARPQRTDAAQTAGLIGVACPATRFCVAVDRGAPDTGLTQGDLNDSAATFSSAMMFNGRSWTRPRAIDRSAQVTAISCSSVGFCALLTAGGLSAVFSGGSWGRPMIISTPLGAAARWLSCPVPRQCVATDDQGQVFQLRNGRWSRPRRVMTAEFGFFYYFPVSCATAQRCVVVSSDGRSTIYDGRTWSRPRKVRGAAVIGFAAISCPSRRTCVAVSAGSALTLRGSTWSRPVTVPDATVLVTISCGSADFCLTSDDGSSSWRFSGGRKWASLPGRGAQQFSCGGPGFCIASMSDLLADPVYFYAAGQWIPVTKGLVGVSGPVTSVYCFRTRLCAVGDNGGDVFWG